MKNNTKPLNTLGFTLIELLIVVVMIAIMVGVAVPAIMSWLPNYQVKGAARMLYGDFQKVRAEALKRNASVKISFATVVPPATGGSYTAFIDDGSGGGTADNDLPDGGELILLRRQMPSSCTLVRTTFVNDIAGYNARGLPLNNIIGGVDITNNNSLWFRLALSNSGYGKLWKSSTGLDGSWSW